MRLCIDKARRIMSIANPNQHNDEWWRARRGKITASRMHRVMDGGARAWRTFATELEGEMLSDTMPPVEEVYAPALKHGIEYEPIARTNAELALNADFDLAGFIPHPAFDFIGASPDFLFSGFPGEIKCPFKPSNHMEVYHSRLIPDKYLAQVQTQIAVCQSPMGYFVSYWHDAPHWKMRLVVLEIPRDQQYINTMIERCQRFKDHILDHKPLVTPISNVKSFF